MKYNHITYGKGFALEVTPPTRSADVMHYLLTGGLLGGRSLDGVVWKEMSADTTAISRNNRG